MLGNTEIKKDVIKECEQLRSEVLIGLRRSRWHSFDKVRVFDAGLTPVENERSRPLRTGLLLSGGGRI